MLQLCSHGLPILGEAGCHVIRTLKQPVEGPMWGGMEAPSQQPAPTCWPCGEALWKHILLGQTRLQMAVALASILTAPS